MVPARASRSGARVTGRGRPPKGAKIEVRLPPEILTPLDAWAADREIPRAEAIRQLLNIAIVTHV
jgi:Ribbon-helix-helix protein, copG family